jgi:hypothetical protein
VPGDQGFTPWTDEGAERLRAAAQEVAQGIAAHAAAVAAAKDEGAFPEVFAANDRLSEALVAYADAQFEYCGNPGPLGLVTVDEDDDAEPVEEPGSVSGFSVLQRCDYEVTDEAAILTAGKEAYRKSWPDASESEASADVSHLGQALYHVAHEGGTWDVLHQTAGVRATGATVRVVPVEATLGPDPDTWPDEPFEFDDDHVIYSVSDVYMN